MIVHPDVVVTPDTPTVRIRESEDNVELDKEIPKILHSQGWGCGIIFNLQFISHDRTQLLKMGQFVVTEEIETLHTTDNPYNPMSQTLIQRKYSQIGDWKIFNNVEEIKIDGPAEVKWNPGKKVFQIKVKDEVVFETENKEEAEKVVANAG